MTNEKITQQIKLHLPDTMLRDVQDAAMVDDRKVSEWVRHVLSLHLYGIKGSSSDRGCNGPIKGDEGQL